MFDPLDWPRVDEQLCTAVRSRNMPAIMYESHKLQTELGPAALCPATITAIQEGNLEASEYLLERCQLDDHVVIAAATTEDTRVVQLILDHGWSINRSLRGGVIPSILVYADRNVVYLDWMLAKGADLNATSALNETVLSFAIREGTMEVVKKLLSLPAMDTSKGDLLHCAVQREESADTVELIDRLVSEEIAQLGAYEFDNDTASRLRYGFPLPTALHVACHEDNISAAEALLRHGADIHQLKKQCDRFVSPTPLELAADKSKELQALFLAYAEKL